MLKEEINLVKELAREIAKEEIKKFFDSFPKAEAKSDPIIVPLASAEPIVETPKPESKRRK